MYRAVDSEGNTLDFIINSARGMRSSAKRFFRKAMKLVHTQEPRVINVDKNAALPKANRRMRVGAIALVVLVGAVIAGFAACQSPITGMAANRNQGVAAVETDPPENELLWKQSAASDAPRQATKIALPGSFSMAAIAVGRCSKAISKPSSPKN